MKKILIANNQFVASLGLKAVAEETLTSCRVEFSDVDSQLLNMLKAKKYDMVIADLNIPKEDKPVSVANILEIQPGLKILAVSARPESIFAEKYLKAGVYGYVENNNTIESFKNAIRAISEGRKYFNLQTARKSAKKNGAEPPKSPFYKLSAMEFKVAVLLLKGRTISGVSDELNLHTSTVSTYRKRIFNKLKITNIVELINFVAAHNVAADIS